MKLVPVVTSVTSGVEACVAAVSQVTPRSVPTSVAAVGVITKTPPAAAPVVLITHVAPDAAWSQEKIPPVLAPQATSDGLAAVPAAEHREVRENVWPVTEPLGADNPAEPEATTLLTLRIEFVLTDPEMNAEPLEQISIAGVLTAIVREVVLPSMARVVATVTVPEPDKFEIRIQPPVVMPDKEDGRVIVGDVMPEL